MPKVQVNAEWLKQVLLKALKEVDQGGMIHHTEGQEALLVQIGSSDIDPEGYEVRINLTRLVPTE